MNTTKLIRHWSMSGARHDVGGLFRATDDIVGETSGDPPTQNPAAAASSLLVKGADEHNWQPFTEAEHGA
jgi:hypothetical protein